MRNTFCYTATVLQLEKKNPPAGHSHGFAGGQLLKREIDLTLSYVLQITQEQTYRNRSQGYQQIRSTVPRSSNSHRRTWRCPDSRLNSAR